VPEEPQVEVVIDLDENLDLDLKVNEGASPIEHPSQHIQVDKGSDDNPEES
jgi:hypothetical protein